METLLSAAQIASFLRWGLTAVGSALVAKNVFNQSEVDGVIQYIPPDFFQTAAGVIMASVSRVWSIFTHKTVAK